VEQRRSLAGRRAEDVADDQSRSLRRRQELHGCEERKLDRLPLDDDRVRLVVAVDVQLAAVALGELREGRVPGDRISHGRLGHAYSSPRLASCRTQVLPSGSLKSANEP
jgi:hypothetical protein